MRRTLSPADAERIVENLIRCGELTDLCLQLRCEAVRQRHADNDPMRRVMAELRDAKERLWQQTPS